VNRAADTVVIGLGNVILSDDGLGVHAVRRLRERPELDADTELVEGGTAGLLLLPYLEDARRVILVDAIVQCARNPHPPGRRGLDERLLGPDDAA
jgi:hydrogenase maturation protease